MRHDGLVEALPRLPRDETSRAGASFAADGVHVRDGGQPRRRDGGHSDLHAPARDLRLDGLGRHEAPRLA